LSYGINNFYQQSLDKGFPVRLKSPQPPLKKGEFIRDLFSACYSIRQLKQTAILFNPGLFSKENTIFNISRRDPYGEIFDISHWDPFGAIF